MVANEGHIPPSPPPQGLYNLALNPLFLSSNGENVEVPFVKTISRVFPCFHWSQLLVDFGRATRIRLLRLISRKTVRCTPLKPICSCSMFKYLERIRGKMPVWEKLCENAFLS
jgi:hypothetical protein